VFVFYFAFFSIFIKTAKTELSNSRSMSIRLSYQERKEQLAFAKGFTGLLSPRLVISEGT